MELTEGVMEREGETMNGWIEWDGCMDGNKKKQLWGVSWMGAYSSRIEGYFMCV